MQIVAPTNVKIIIAQIPRRLVKHFKSIARAVMQ